MSTPRRHIPTVLSDYVIPPREVAYAIGVEHSPGEFGMTNGPTLLLEDMLEVFGEPRAVIMRFNSDWTDDPIWRREEGGGTEILPTKLSDGENNS